MTHIDFPAWPHTTTTTVNGSGYRLFSVGDTTSMQSIPPMVTNGGKLAPALVKAQADVRAAGKTGDNKFDRYNYAKLEDFYDAAKPVLAKHGLAVLFQTDSCESLPDRVTKNGGAEHTVRVRVSATLVHESGESVTVTGYGEGQDRADKATYKAITGAKKYVLAGLLAIPTSDDPEADEKVGLSAKGGTIAKTDSKGNVTQKIPEWTKEQKEEAGGYVTSIMGMLEKLHPIMGEAADRLAKWRQLHKYDQPMDAIDALGEWKSELEAKLALEG